MATNYRRLSDISLRIGSLISSLRNITEQDCCYERDGGIYELESRAGVGGAKSGRALRSGLYREMNLATCGETVEGSKI